MNHNCFHIIYNTRQHFFKNTKQHNRYKRSRTTFSAWHALFIGYVSLNVSERTVSREIYLV